MSAAGQVFPWRRLMFLGLGLLRLAPRDFWALTLRELSAALGEGTSPFERARLDEMMKEFPDHGGE